MQDEHPIAYLSKALGQKNRALSIYEKEFLALMLAVKIGDSNSNMLNLLFELIIEL
jgi:hypothetical protein